MPGARVRVRIHGDRPDAHAARGGGDATGDFPAIGNQNLGEHLVSSKPAGVLMPARFLPSLDTSLRDYSGPSERHAVLPLLRMIGFL
jgi:hypothetical protein